MFKYDYFQRRKKRIFLKESHCALFNLHDTLKGVIERKLSSQKGLIPTQPIKIRRGVIKTGPKFITGSKLISKLNHRKQLTKM